MNKNVVSTIVKYGSVVVGTLSSFVIKPPVIADDLNSGVDWKNIFTFFAGVACILLFGKVKENRVKPRLFILLSVFFPLVVAYEYLYQVKSCNCYPELEGGIRSVIVDSKFINDDVGKQFEFWSKDPSPYQKLLEAHSCSSTEVWNIKDLLPVYYSFIVLYFILLIVLTCILILLSQLIKNSPDVSNSP